MRLTAVVVALLVSGCAGTQIDATQPVDRACSVSECFLERDVREFEVLDATTLVVYVGAQRCAFKVQLYGTFCDLTFAPEIVFRSSSDALTPTQPDVLSAPLPNSGLRDLRVCSGDLKIGVDGGPLAQSSVVPPGNSPAQRVRSQCRLSSVSSLTDNQVLELYVAHDKVAPPPPMGGGQIEVGEQTEEGSGAPHAEGAPAPPNEEPPRG
ncbi:MAG TPA: hypothetical protein VFX89_16380 [Gammaproteobacteria bacterium]|nr:hypothetical protein [Gammaproteobacteria bacterium]